jgi:hypothetical protein
VKNRPAQACWGHGLWKNGVVLKIEAAEIFPYKSVLFSLIFVIAHNIVHKICVENDRGKASRSHTNIC